MPKFTVTHPETGRRVTIAGPTMPTEAELDEIFKQTANVAPPQAAQADGIGQTDGIIDVTAQGGDGLRTALKSGMSTAEAMDKGLVNNADDLDRARWLRENFIHDTATAPTEAKETLLSIGRQFADNLPNAKKDLAGLVTGGIDFSKPTAPPTGLGDFLTRVVPESAVKTAVGAVTAPYHMIKNVTDPMVEAVFDPMKQTPYDGGVNNGMIQNVKDVSDFIAAPLGFKRDQTGNVQWSMDNAANQWGTDPVGSLLALAPTAKLGKEAAAAGGGKLASLAADIVPPERFARSALKPYIGESAARQSNVAKGLQTVIHDKNASPSMSRFMQRNLQEMEDVAGRQEILLNDKGNPMVSIQGVRAALKKTVDEARETPGTADAAVNAADKVLQDIMAHPEYDAATDSIPLNTVQSMKKRIWRRLRERNTFDKDSTPELQDAMWDAATGMNEIINQHIPEMKGENARYGELANVNKLLKRAIDRTANNNVIPLRALIQLVRGDVRGFAQGGVAWLVDHPSFKLYLAQRLGKAKGRSVTPKEVDGVTERIKADLVQRDQTVLDSEALPKVSNGNLGDTIDPTAYAPEYGWEGKPPAAPEVANPEVLPPRQSSQMPVISDQRGRIVPQVESMTKRIPQGFNPEVAGTEESQLGDRLAPKPKPLRDAGNGPKSGIPPQEPPPTAPTAPPAKSGRAIVGEGFHPETANYLKQKLSSLDSEFPSGKDPIKIVTDDKTGNLEHDGFTGELRMRPYMAQFSPADLEKVYTGWAKSTGTLPGLDATIDHEFAHVVDGRIIRSLADDAAKEEYWNAKKALMEKLGYPSEYAKKNQSEWLAEQFAYERANGVKGGIIDFLKERLPKVDTGTHPAAVRTWKEYVAANMSRAMKEAGSHGEAMKKLAKEWGQVTKQKQP